MRLRTIIGFGGLTVVAALIGIRATNKSVGSRWYSRLDKPTQMQPPREAFGPVWTTLYALMAGSASRVDGRATTMMAPYLAWTAFATVLNGTIAKNN